jgi:hypothetical protein
MGRPIFQLDNAEIRYRPAGIVLYQKYSVQKQFQLFMENNDRNLNRQWKDQGTIAGRSTSSP